MFDVSSSLYMLTCMSERQRINALADVHHRRRRVQVMAMYSRRLPFILFTEALFAQLFVVARYLVETKGARPGGIGV
jgi:hypothetical protein